MNVECVGSSFVWPKTPAGVVRPTLPSRRGTVMAESVEIPTGADLLSVTAVPGIHLLLYYI